MRRHVYYYTLIATAFDNASALIEGDPAVWLPAGSGRHEGGWEVPLRADGALAGSLDTVAAIVAVGPTVRHGSQLMRSISWQSASATRIFPKLDADLALDSLEGAGCHLSLMGTYRPPLSVVGGAADMLYGHRVAEACVRRFVLDIADRLTASQGESMSGARTTPES